MSRSFEDTQGVAPASLIVPQLPALISTELQKALIQREVSSHPPPQGGHLRIGDFPQSAPAGATAQFAQLPTSYLRTIFIDNSKERVGKNIDYNINVALKVVQGTFKDPSDKDLCYSKDTRLRLLQAALDAEQGDEEKDAKEAVTPLRGNLSEEPTSGELGVVGTSGSTTSFPSLKTYPSSASNQRSQQRIVPSPPPPQLPTLPPIFTRSIGDAPKTARDSTAANDPPNPKLTTNEITTISRPASAASSILPDGIKTNAAIDAAMKNLKNVVESLPSSTKRSQFISTVRGMYGELGPMQDRYIQNESTTVEGLRRHARNIEPASESDEDNLDAQGFHKTLAGWQKGDDEGPTGTSTYGGTSNSLARILKKSEINALHDEPSHSTKCPHCELSRDDPPLYQMTLDKHNKAYTNAFKKSTISVDYAGFTKTAAIAASTLSTQTTRLRSIETHRRYGNLPLGALTPDMASENLWHAVHLLQPPKELQVNAYPAVQRARVPRLSSDEWSVVAARHFTKHIGVPPWQEHFIRMRRELDEWTSYMQQECDTILQRIRDVQTETDRMKVRTKTLERVLDIRNPSDERIRLRTQLSAVQQELVLRKWEVEETARTLESDRQEALRHKANTVIVHEQIRRTVAQITDMVDLMSQLNLVNHEHVVADARTRTFNALAPLNIVPGVTGPNGQKRNPLSSNTRHCSKCLLLTSSSPFCTVTGDPHQRPGEDETEDLLPQLSDEYEGSFGNSTRGSRTPSATFDVGDFSESLSPQGQQTSEHTFEESESSEDNEQKQPNNSVTRRVPPVGKVDLSNFNPNKISNSKNESPAKSTSKRKGGKVKDHKYKEVNPENDRKPSKVSSGKAPPTTKGKRLKKGEVKKQRKTEPHEDGPGDETADDGSNVIIGGPDVDASLPLSHLNRQVKQTPPSPHGGSEMASDDLVSEGSLRSVPRRKIPAQQSNKKNNRRSTVGGRLLGKIVKSAPSQSSSSSRTPSSSSSSTFDDEEEEETNISPIMKHSNNNSDQADGDSETTIMVLSPTSSAGANARRVTSMQGISQFTLPAHSRNTSSKRNRRRNQPTSPGDMPPVSFSASTRLSPEVSHLEPESRPLSGLRDGSVSPSMSTVSHRSGRSTVNHSQAHRPRSKVPLEVISDHISKFLGAAADKDFRRMRHCTRALLSSPLFTNLFTDGTIRLIGDCEEQFYSWYSVVGRPPPLSCTEIPSWNVLSKRIKIASLKNVEQKIIGLKREVRNLQYAFQKRPKGRSGGAVLDDQSFAVLALKISELEKKNSTLRVRIRQANELKRKLVNQRLAESATSTRAE